MNKYQESLDFLRNKAKTSSKSDYEILLFHLDVIEELVDKETSKKPKFNKQLDIVGCPACDFCDMMWGTFIKTERCPKCGQAMDWSDEE